MQEIIYPDDPLEFTIANIIRALTNLEDLNRLLPLKFFFSQDRDIATVSHCEMCGWTMLALVKGNIQHYLDEILQVDRDIMGDDFEITIEGLLYFISDMEKLHGISSNEFNGGTVWSLDRIKRTFN